MKYNYIILLISLVAPLTLQTCKPVLEPELSPDEIQTITTARLVRISEREIPFFGLDFEKKAIADLNKMRYGCESYQYDSGGNIAESYRHFCETAADTSSHATYKRSSSSVIYRPYRFSYFTDTLTTNPSGYVLKNAFRPKLIDLHPGGQYQYDLDGYLVKEESVLYQSIIEGDAKITLEHNYSAGDRVKTVISYLPNFNITPKRAVITYEYDQSNYNPNLPYDNYNLFGDQGLFGGIFAHYAKYHFSLYGKLNRHLLIRAHVSELGDRPVAIDYDYKYTFDEKKRVSSVFMVGRTNDAMELSQRLFEYADK